MADAVATNLVTVEAGHYLSGSPCFLYVPHHLQLVPRNGIYLSLELSPSDHRCAVSEYQSHHELLCTSGK